MNTVGFGCCAAKDVAKRAWELDERFVQTSCKDCCIDSLVRVVSTISYILRKERSSFWFTWIVGESNTFNHGQPTSCPALEGKARS